MSSTIAERVERVRRLRQPALDGELRGEAVLRAGLCDVEAIRSWASAAEARIVSELLAVASMPEASIAAATRSSINAASATRERSDTLDHANGFDGALETGTIVTGHVDELTKAAKKLDDHAQRSELFERSETLLADAERSTIDQFRRVLAREVKAIQRDDGMERLARQQRATSMATWTDDDGMWNLRAKFDPLTGVKISNTIDRALGTLFAEQTPDSCPADPVEKQQHLKALALARLIGGDHTVARVGRPACQQGATAGIAGVVSGLRHSGLQVSFRSMQDPSHRLVERRRAHRPCELAPSLCAPSSQDPRRRLACFDR